MSERRIERVVVVGGGTAGWMAAAALAKIFGPRLSIRLVESDEIGIVGVGEATIPPIRQFNDLLGLDENEFLRQTQGTIKLGIEFVDWLRPGHRYLHDFAHAGVPLGGVPFHHTFFRGRAAGLGDDLWGASFNAAACRSGRFDRVDHVGQTRLQGLTYAFHFDASLYSGYLRAFAEGLGARRTEGKVVDWTLRPDDGHVASVRLESGEEVEGDLFVDCSGFRGLLIEQALQTGYDDWSGWLPANRAMAVPCTSVEAPTPYTRSTADKAGWRWRIPLQHRVGNGYVYCSEFISDDEAASRLIESLDGEALADPRPLRFTTGKRRKLWNKNVVALGLASGFLEPLESTSIHLIQSGVARLLQFFPNRRIEDADVDQYNRLCDREFEQIKAFLILHYKQTERDDTPFWRHCRALPSTPDLDRKLAMFKASARIYRDHEDLFTESSWLQVMYGQGVVPDDWHPAADKLTDQQLASFLTDVRRLVAEAAARLPTHADWIARNCAARPGETARPQSVRPIVHA